MRSKNSLGRRQAWRPFSSWGSTGVIYQKSYYRLAKIKTFLVSPCL
ncbi:MAG: hypothetical protein OEM26_06615 [Saprospiraceae bacterium]|nr:hypothetical protein [Saprospiraceae bacterium]